MEKDCEVKTIIVDYVCYVCDDCGGEVVYTDGNMLLTCPPKFVHKCSKCNKEYTFTWKYPYTKYVRNIK